MLFGYVGRGDRRLPSDRGAELDRPASHPGRPARVLFTVWLAGRLAVSSPASSAGSSRWRSMPPSCCCLRPPPPRNRRRSRVEQPEGGRHHLLLAVTNIAFHVEAHFEGLAEYSTRAGIGLVVTLVCVIGGRIVPSFTRNWLARRAPGRMPVPSAASMRRDGRRRLRHDRLDHGSFGPSWLPSRSASPAGSISFAWLRWAG